MRSAALTSIVLFLSCSNSPSIPGPDGGDTGGGMSGTGGGTAATGGGGGGGTGATGGGTGAGGGAATGGSGGGATATGGGMQMANDAGTCTSACDCNAGDGCQMGHCHHGNVPVYCCGSTDCPGNSVCESDTGMFSVCARADGGRPRLDGGASLDGGMCRSACECTSGDACFQGQCFTSPVTIYCCDDPTCPGGARCQRENGGMARCGQDGGMMMPPGDGGAFDYCPFIPCSGGDAGQCLMAGCSSCDSTGACAK